MAGRDLFAQQAPAGPAAPSTMPSRAPAPRAPGGRDLFTPQVSQSPQVGMQVRPEQGQRRPSMPELFEKYSLGEFTGQQRAAVEELMRRSLERVPVEKPKEAASGNLAQRTAGLAGNMLLNLPGSTFSLLNDMGKAMLSPVATANTIGEVALGAVQKVIPGEQRAEETFDTLVKGFQQKYGSLENLNATLAEDPASVLLDMSAALTGGGTLMAKTPQLAKYGEALQKAGAAIDPIALTGRGASKVASGLGEGATQLLGVMTGEGAPVMKQALKGTGLTSETSAFVKGMRKETRPENLIADVKDALYGIKETRSARYRQALADIGADKTALDLNPIKTRLIELLGPDRYNIRITPEGKLDFSRSTVQRTERSKIQELVNDVSSWGSKPGDNTAAGLDILKKKLDDFYSENRNTRAFVTSLKDTVKKTIVDQVPKYAEMTKEYEQITRLVKDMESSLALGNRATMDTTLRKLTGAVKEDFEFRRTLLSELEQISGRKLSEEIAGLSMQSLPPKRLTGRVAAGGTAGAIGAGVISPWFLSIAATTSPRVMGEFLNAFGFSKNQVNKAVGVLKRTGAFDQAPRQAAAITGRQTEGEK